MKHCFVGYETCKEEPLFYTNYDLDNVVSPVDVEGLGKLLKETCYNEKESEFLLDGFKNGFDIGYRGCMKVRQLSPNLKIRIGNETILWNKVMKEVKKCRYVGPYEEIPFPYFIQSPIGLVPKDNGHDT